MECQLINVERMMKLKNHHLASNRVIIKEVSSMNTKTSGYKVDNWQGIYIISKNFLIKSLLITKGKNSNFTAEKTGRHHLNQVIRVTITGKETQQYHVQSDMMPVVCCQNA